MQMFKGTVYAACVNMPFLACWYFKNSIHKLQTYVLKVEIILLVSICLLLLFFFIKSSTYMFMFMKGEDVLITVVKVDVHVDFTAAVSECGRGRSGSKRDRLKSHL